MKYRIVSKHPSFWFRGVQHESGSVVDLPDDYAGSEFLDAVTLTRVKRTRKKREKTRV